MNKIIKATLISLLALGFAACAEPADAPQVPSEPAMDEAAPAQPQALADEALRTLTETAQVEGPWLFAMETSPKLAPLTLHGSRQERLVGRLADHDGRREVVYYGKARQAPKVVFGKDWLLPAVGSKSGTGELLVCVNRLVGVPSDLTKGNMPDPAGGVDLVCRWHTTRGWSRELKVPRRGAALWLNDVVARRDGTFRITYSMDHSGLLVDDPSKEEGIYRVLFDRGRFLTPELASRFPQP